MSPELPDRTLTDLTDQEILVLIGTRGLKVEAIDPAKDGEAARSLEVILHYLIISEARLRGLPFSPQEAIDKAVRLFRENVKAVSALRAQP